MERKTKRRGLAGRIFLISIVSLSVVFIAAFAILVVSKLYDRGAGYPRRFQEQVAASAAEYGLDENLVYAVIRTESGFDEDAVSAANAKGLMQLMDVTGEWVCWRKGEEFDKSRIFEPDYNIDLGCFLLSYLLDRYNGDAALAAAAYNAGAGKVDEWLKDPKYYDGKELSIPYPETKSYVKKVLDAYEKYTEFSKQGK